MHVWTCTHHEHREVHSRVDMLNNEPGGTFMCGHAHTMNAVRFIYVWTCTHNEQRVGDTCSMQRRRAITNAMCLASRSHQWVHVHAPCSPSEPTGYRATRDSAVSTCVSLVCVRSCAHFMHRSLQRWPHVNMCVQPSTGYFCKNEAHRE